MMVQINRLRHSKIEADRRHCISLLEAHLAKNSNDVEAWYNKACCHDFLGEEKEAEPCYRKCFELGWQGLPPEEHKSFFVGYGSTLRNNLKYDESVQVLEEGIRHFPNFPALKVFLAFTFYSQRQEHKAAELLFKVSPEIAKSGLDGYERAIQWYADILNEHPERRE